MAGLELNALMATGPADKAGLLRARAAAARIARALEDGGEGVEAGLFDAFLRLQLALVAGDGTRVQSERLTIVRLAQGAETERAAA